MTLEDTYELLADKKTFLAALPNRPPSIGPKTSGFGVRVSPTSGRVKIHEGLDIANRWGTPIRTTADGVVKFAGVKNGYGNVIIVDHGYGLATLYAHCARLTSRRGERVARGQEIALMGNTGGSTGVHVHYEVRVNGVPVDPLPYIFRTLD